MPLSGHRSDIICDAAYHGSDDRAGQAERVRVSADVVTVSHEMGQHVRMVWSSPTAFTRVTIDAPGAPDVRVRLHLSARALTIAGVPPSIYQGVLGIIVLGVVLFQARIRR